ncbi:MAG: precorrin-3B synthase [Mycobacteriaceae bacterium]|nr:precorrin-3B synthase [Mycobacteriaceae bacterium]
MPRARDVDACPGVLEVHHAADGAVVRIRLPGGMITAAQLATLAIAANQFASGALELTARGNIQLRGVADLGAVTALVAEADLLPSRTHERIRNIVASPLSGRRGGHVDVRTWVIDLDDAIQARPELASLPGRFWFSIDDGRADVSGLGADVGLHVLGDTSAAGCALLLAGRDTGIRLPANDVPHLIDALVGVGLRFAALRGTSWRVKELANPVELLAGVAGPPSLDLTLARGFAPVTTAPVGWIDQDDNRVALGAAVPLGVLPADVAACLAGIGAPLVVTPWRSMLVCDLDEDTADAALRVLAPLGLVFDEHSPWLRISSCTGRPGCVHAAADVRADASLAVRSEQAGWHRHFVGCERACGSPPTGEVLVATAEGYRVLRRQP